MNPDLLYNSAYKTILLSDEVERIRLRQSKVDDTINTKLQIGDNSLLVGPEAIEHPRVLLEAGKVAIGINTLAEADNSIAIGHNAGVIGGESTKKGGIAIGHNAIADGKEAIAIGKNAQIHNNRIRIGRTQTHILLGGLLIELSTQYKTVSLSLVSSVTDTEEGPDPDESYEGINGLYLGNNIIRFDNENDSVVFRNVNGKETAINLT
jgi:hypothetical protein